MSSLNARINLQLDMQTCIRVEKESEKRGITRTQYIKESINEKLNNIDSTNLSHELDLMQSDIKELKTLSITILEKLREK